MKHEHCIIESLLFVSQNSLHSSRIGEILKVETKEATRLVEEYAEILKTRNSALQVVRDPDGYRLGTRQEYAGYVELLIAPKETKLSYQALETLSVIAFRQPITKQEMEKIRGINSDGIINTLFARGLIKVVGVKKLPGNPKLYGVSKDFFKYFGIKSMGELKSFFKSIEIDTSKLDALFKDDSDPGSNILFEDPNQESFDFGEDQAARAAAEQELASQSGQEIHQQPGLDGVSGAGFDESVRNEALSGQDAEAEAAGMMTEAYIEEERKTEDA